MTVIWLEAHEMGINLTARNFAGVLNGQADRLSRLSCAYEWRLHPKVLQFLDTVWGPDHVDRFATMTNAQFPVYNSFRNDPMSLGVDALAQDLAGTNSFCYPPWRLIPRILDKMDHCNAQATLIVPEWQQL